MRETKQAPRQIDVRLIKEDNPASLPATVLQATAPILAVGGAISVLLLSFGWSFGWYWFAIWNVPFASLNLGPDNLFEYGRIVVIRFWYLALLWLLIVCAVVFCIFRNKLGKAILAASLTAVFLLPWLCSDFLGAKAAERSAKLARSENYSAWSEVHLILTQDYSSVLPANILASLSEGPDLCHRLLFRADDGLWLVRMNSVGHPGAAIFVPEDAVAYLRLRLPRGADC